MKPAASIDVYRVALHRVLGASVFRQLPGLLALTASALTVAGCNVGLTAPNSTQSSDTVGAAVNLDAGPDSVTVMPESGSLDAGSNTTVVPSPALATSGSPLCNTAVLGLGCDPDKPACVFDADAGPDSGVCTRGAVCSPQLAGPAIATAACRVVAGFSKPSPSCSTAFGSGREGDRCTNSADCDIDFECIGDSTLGTLRLVRTPTLTATSKRCFTASTLCPSARSALRAPLLQPNARRARRARSSTKPRARPRA